LIRVAREASYERSDQALLEGTHSIIIITLFKSEKCLFTVYKLLSFLFYFSFVPSSDLLSNMKEAAIFFSVGMLGEVTYRQFVRNI